jgi:choline dehydrogenase-like flavoprotein
MNRRVEHLVVGSGAGGALTAALLAEAGREVLVLEEGPWIEPSEVELFSLDQMARQYRSGGVTPALGRPPVAYVEGCCVGGSTEVNIGIFQMADAATFERWRQTHHVEDLTLESLAPYAAANDEALAVQGYPWPYPKGSRALFEGAEAVGCDAPEVSRCYSYETGKPVKQSMLRTYLPRATRAGALVEANRRVERLVLREGRARGAKTANGVVEAEHIWLCAGAVGTAAILQRSGVRRRVGATLGMHPTMKLAARFAEPTDAAADVPVHQVKPVGKKYFFGGSVSRPGQVALTLSDAWQANRVHIDGWRNMAVYYVALSGGHGRVMAVPGLRDPVVTYRVSRQDLAALGDGMHELARLLFAAGAEAVFPSVRGCGAITDVREAGRLQGAVTASRSSIMTVHLFSTAPMGENEALCPVDSYGRVRGVDGLRVNDASLLPDAPGTNPQATVMAIAARNVAHWLDTATA